MTSQEKIGIVTLSKIKKPRKEGKPKHVLLADEFQRIIGDAKGNPRAYALLQLMFQTGVRVSEIITIHLSDLERTTLTHHRKGRKKRTNPLEKKLHALQSYLLVQPETYDTHLFVNYQGQGLSIGECEAMVAKYARHVHMFYS